MIIYKTEFLFILYDTHLARFALKHVKINIVAHLTSSDWFRLFDIKVGVKIFASYTCICCYVYELNSIRDTLISCCPDKNLDQKN